MSPFYMFRILCGSNIQLTQLRIQLKVHKNNIYFIYLFKYRVLSFEKYNVVKKLSSNILLYLKKTYTLKKKIIHDPGKSNYKIKI